MFVKNINETITIKTKAGKHFFDIGNVHAQPLSFVQIIRLPAFSHFSSQQFLFEKQDFVDIYCDN